MGALYEEMVPFLEAFIYFIGGNNDGGKYFGKSFILMFHLFALPSERAGIKYTCEFLLSLPAKNI